ncbi:phosphotransferase [Rhodanobacter sp. L36]|uniref:phosphotransferase enzyme family protein n=1 Tax=Rhodanobacter sp. L36 TaxID=1747221 RepID=UPI00131BE2D9|nr:phosphotransferase [Rhodanobacter sp. L36]
MNETIHQVHGLAGDAIAPDWPALTESEVDTLLRRYPQLGRPIGIEWHSPRPLSAACLVKTETTTVFVKRHHCSVRTVRTLTEEHRFMAHQRAAGIPVPEVFSDMDGQTALAMDDWIYEIHRHAAGVDVYREAISWSPLPNHMHALTAGRMLAAMHDAASGYNAPQRDTHLLVARCELIASPNPVDALRAQFPQRPGLADYLRDRDWATDLREVLAPWHAKLQPRLAQQPRLWTHGDWHVSNLCWSDHGDDARITSVLDFGLSAATFAMFDLATAIERNAIAWLSLENADAAHTDIARTLLEGYRQQRTLSRDDVHLLADLLPLVHVDFALSEVEYFHAITHARTSADVAYDIFLRGHAAWFGTAQGEAFLENLHDLA